VIELWDSRLERFGASQLNDRFAARFAEPMSSAAWAGWFAVKVAWEASQRAGAVDGAAIAAYLERDTSSFDGQKGVPLSFRRWDHQLRQPLYVRKSAAPHASRTDAATPVPDGAPSRESLDSLGTTREMTSCRWP
jgi:ABC transporter substrate binding protein (PQQ-dependent alcohol dehydrogenase system)